MVKWAYYCSRCRWRTSGGPHYDEEKPCKKCGAAGMWGYPYTRTQPERRARRRRTRARAPYPGRPRGPMAKWGGSGVQKMRTWVFDIYGTKCWYCGKPGATQIDHLKPRSLYPSFTWCIGNCRPVHPECNQYRAGMLTWRRAAGPGAGQLKFL